MSEQEFCINLVEAVEKYPCIYNCNLPDYSKKHVVDKAWENIAIEINNDVQNCKKKWKNIRTVLSRHLKNSSNNGKREKAYYLGDMLQFVIPFLKTKTDISEILPSSVNSTECDIIIDENGPDLVIDDAENETNAESEPETPSSITNHSEASCSNEIEPTRKTLQISSLRKRKQGPTSEQDETFTKFCNSLAYKKEDNSAKLFLLSLLPDLQDMSSYQLRQFKRRVLEVVDDIIEMPNMPKHSFKTEKE